MFLQRTIRSRAVVEGIGLHTGQPAKLTFCPAPEGTGIYFVRRDLPGHPAISPHIERVRATTLATTLGSDDFSVSTVEHCLSALAAFRVDNLLIELDGPEIPIGDGSAKVFLDALLAVGFVEQNQPRTYTYITEPIFEGDQDKHAYMMPYNGLRVTCTIDFPHPAIGKQTIDLEITEQSFIREISGARTFGFLKEVEMMRSKGLALGGSLENAVVLDPSAVLNPEGVRWPDEFVRHKVLDALGDLGTLGSPLMGHLVLHRAGHDLMNKLVRRIHDTPGASRRLELGANFSDAPSDPFSLFGVN
jgi:UDP-3-O-[3-hydroxymyristoyl] N-acetylglucosamine deacetylase